MTVMINSGYALLFLLLFFIYFCNGKLG